MHQFNPPLIRNLCLSVCIGTLLACQTMPENTRDTAAVVAVAAPNKTAATTVTDLTVTTINIATAVAASYDDLWRRMQAGFQLRDDYAQAEVVSRLQYYTDNQRYFDLVSERAAPFLYWIVEEVDRRHLPQELALVPIVESTFNPNAYSGEHAVGLWQFVGATGKSFGLQQDWWYDARREPRAATIAALDYLQIFYGQFNENWMLALAAYNTGDSNLRRAIRKSGQGTGIIDFWNLPLPRETHAHVAKILARAKVISLSLIHISEPTRPY